MGLLAEDLAFHSNIPVSLDIAVAVVYSVFGVCSLFGNSTLLYVSYKKKHLLKPAEFFIINLAVSDLGLTLSLYPMAITSSFYHRWLYGETACSLYAFCGMLFGLCSLTTLTLLSLVCFVKVCHPLYGNRFSCFHGRLLVASAWVYAFLFACSPLAHWGQYGPEPYGTACCIDWRQSNQQHTARSYTVALFVFCYILPCCVMVASYTGILVRVQASRRSVEQHVARQIHRNSTHTIIVKLSVAVCVGFLAAWSPYAVVSMWAAFGHIESIPPLAFAMPAMLAKSSTIYNPIIYLMLRPNFRRLMCRDLGCFPGCPCLHGQSQCCTKPDVRVRLRPVQRMTNQLLSLQPSLQPPMMEIRDPSWGKCKQEFELFTHCPHTCSVTILAPKDESSKEQLVKVLHGAGEQGATQRRSVMAMMCSKRSSETDNFYLPRGDSGQSTVGRP